MAKKNILVFPCGSEIGLDIYSSVCDSTYFNLIGGSSVEDHGKFVYKRYIGNIPFINDPNFIPSLKNIVRENHIDAIYPTMDEAITIIKKHEGQLGCRIISSPLETVQLCLSKRDTYRNLTNIIRVPQTYSISEDIEYPVFVKPNIGYGARGTKTIRSRQDLEAVIRENTDLLICELLPGEEYTVDCFTDRHGTMLYTNARKRNRIKGGISVNTSFVNDTEQDKFARISLTINKRIKFRGAWFYQVKKDAHGELCLLEIASRLGGSSLLSRALGINLAMLSLFDAFDYDVSIVKNDYYIELDRALDNKYTSDITYTSAYIDYDDCLILDNERINTNLVKFIFNCINRGIKVSLLTKHIGDLERDLHKYRLYHLFDKIIHISPDDEKHKYIKDDNAIFIDDSHAERKKVKEETGIAVFSPDMIDVLI